MKSFEAKGKETEELHKRFKKLEQEWQGFKDSKPTTRTTRASHKHSLHSSNETIHKPRQYSPRELMFNHCTSNQTTTISNQTTPRFAPPTKHHSSNQTITSLCRVTTHLNPNCAVITKPMDSDLLRTTTTLKSINDANLRTHIYSF